MTTKLHRIWAGPGSGKRVVFLPNFWMRLLPYDDNEKPVPSNYVKFQVSKEMSRFDVREYLEKVYGLETVREVRMHIVEGRKHRHPTRPELVGAKDDDIKIANVILKRGEKFEFPNLLSGALERFSTQLQQSQQSAADVKESAKSSDILSVAPKRKDPSRTLIGDWFSST